MCFTEIQTQQHFSQDHRDIDMHRFDICTHSTMTYTRLKAYDYVSNLSYDQYFQLLTWDCTLLIQMPFLLVKFHCICRRFSHRYFLMAPPERGKGGVGGNQINVKQCFKSNFDLKFDTKPLVTPFCSFKLQHYWLSSSEIKLHEPKLLFTRCIAL